MPSTEKLIWFLVILFLHILGAGLYYIIARPNGTARIA
jgi:Phospholipase_D-nuclease N-terminal